MPSGSIRLFIAVYPPAEVAGALLETLDGMTLPPHRLVPVEQVHLTLQFVGDVEAGRVDAVLESVRRSAAGVPCFDLTPERLVRLPERGPARLVAAACDVPAPVLELKTRLARRLARSPRERPARGFLPHLTLCRFRQPQRLEEDLPRPPATPFTVDSIRAMRSVLGPAGARHHEVLRVDLVGANR